MNLEPLEVFALTSDMQRATGSIPYTSLMWDRKYYEPGSFLMELPANVYDPSWAYIYTDERPETGIIQKVEYSDTATTAGGVDTVILSGFFLEHELNRYTFLVEETEEEAYRIYKPAPAKTVKPTMWTDSLGQTYVKTGGSGGVLAKWETIDGDYVDPATIDQSTLTQVDLGAGEGMKLIEYPTTNTDRFPSGKWTANEYTNGNYSYYSEDGKTLHSVAPNGEEKTFPILRGGTGDVIYEGEDGELKWVNGVSSSLGGTYVRARDSWESMVRSEGLEVVEGDGSIFGGSTYARAYRTVKGPWQLRTDLDVNEPADNVQRIIQWAQDIWGNNLLYDEVGFAGEEKIIDPSLKLFGDLAYEELKTIGASPRLSYSFESDTCVFEIWRGLDRTQSQAGVPAPPTPDEPEPDELYEELDYIVSTGAQWIDTGFCPKYDTRVELDISNLSSTTCMILGSKNADSKTATDQFSLFKSSATTIRSDYFGTNASMTVSDTTARTTIVKDGKTATAWGATATNTAVSSGVGEYPMYLLALNTAGSMSAGAPCICRTHGSRIFDGGTGGVLVRDYVPRRRVSDGAVGLLDLVHGVFYTSAGSEPFLAPGELPSGYTRLEYIESTGSQYVNTGIVPNNATRVTMGFRFTSTPSSQVFLFGARNATSGANRYGFTFLTNSSALRNVHGASTANFATSVDITARHDVDKAGHLCSLDSGAYAANATSGTVTPTVPMYLFASNENGTAGMHAAIECDGCCIYGDGITLDRDYVPAKNSGGEAGLFDLVTMTFFADAAGVGFVAGPEVAQVAAVAEVSAFALTRTVATSDESNTAANPFAVFSDTWGTLYGFTASRDVSNYRNTCYVLYQFRDQTDADGNPIGPRGFVKARLEDELPDAETYLDLRGEEPEDGQTDEAFIESLRQRGLAHLQANYAAIESLDTGTLTGSGYLDGYDLGDKVDMLVEAIGLVKEARITGVCEVHEAGSSTATLEIGEQKLTNIRKAVIV